METNLLNPFLSKKEIGIVREEEGEGGKEGDGEEDKEGGKGAKAREIKRGGGRGYTEEKGEGEEEKEGRE